MRINNNLAALNAWRNLTISGNNMQKSLERLSSGYRINRAADDAAGLAVSEKMRAQIRGLSMALRNTQDGISLLQTAEGGAAKIQDMLQRMRELAVQSASGSLEDADRAQLQLEFEELAKEINRTAKTTTFNNQALVTADATAPKSVLGTVAAKGFTLNVAKGQTPTIDALDKGVYTIQVTETGDTTTQAWEVSLVGADGNTIATTGVTALGDVTVTFSTTDLNLTLKGNLSAVNSDGIKDTSAQPPETVGWIIIGQNKSYEIQVGANTGETVQFEISDLTGQALGITANDDETTLKLADGIGIKTASEASATIQRLDVALSIVTSARAKMGAYQNRLESTVSTLQTQYENLTAAESRIRDVDMAREMAEFTRYQILQQAGTAMLAQANMLPQSILSLLR